MLVALFGWTAPTRATHISCGVAIEADTTFDSDVTCAGEGLTVRTSGVTIDLAGHKLEGAGRGFAGIGAAPGVSAVTIEHGSIGRFHNAIALTSGSGHVLRDVRAYDSHDGILLNSVGSALLDRVTSTGNDGSGIHTPVSANITVRRSHIYDNAAGVGGVGLRTSTFERNLIEGNTFYGIYYLAATDNVFDRNRLLRNGGMGLRLESGAAGNRLVRNRVSQTTGSGIVVADDAGANLLLRNRSNRNTGDGFEILAPDMTLIRNFASRNAALGFNAPGGAALARRNHAHHNGDRRQCVGIPCRGR
jgi:hypothetical protein